MNFLVLGASGMAGHMICMYLKERGHTVTGFCRRTIPLFHTIAGDAKDIGKLRQVICENQFDVIINAVGILNKNAEKNKADAVFLNGYLPHFLAEITADMDTWVIHMSTDCVFSGKNSNYTEDAPYDGQTFYDRTKAIGELIDYKNVTLRNSIVGPDINPDGVGLFNWFMNQKGTVSGYRKVIWTGVTTLELAKIIEYVSLNKKPGLFNMVYKDSISKYDLLKLFNKYLRNNTVHIVPSDEIVLDKSLIRTNFDINYLVPDYETMVLEMSEWMYAHKELYAHYNLQER